MSSGYYTYETDESTDFELDWYAYTDTENAQFNRLLEATAEKCEEYLSAALDIGEYWQLEDVELRLTHWEKPKATVWLRGPPGYLTEDSDEEDAAEKVRQRKEFYRNHNAVHNERLYVDGHLYNIDIDVRQF